MYKVSLSNEYRSKLNYLTISSEDRVTIDFASVLGSFKKS